MWLVLPSSAFAATLTVGSNGDYQTIQAAVDEAEPGDIIEIEAGTYTEAIVINTPLWLRGEGRKSTILQSPGDEPAVRVRFTSNVEMRGFTFMAAETEPALDVQEARVVVSASDVVASKGEPNTSGLFKAELSELIMFNMDFDGTGATAEKGGLLELTSGALSCSDCTFRNGTATQTGGAIHSWGAEVTFRNAIFEDNRAQSGGALWSGGPAHSLLTLERSTFERNEAEMTGKTFAGVGGAVAVYGASAHIHRSFFRNNVASENGGAIDMTFTDGSLIEDTHFEDNKAKTGGGLSLVRMQNTSVRQNTFSNHIAANYAGAVYVGGMGDVDLQGNRFCNSSAPEGGLLTSNPWSGPIDVTASNNLIVSSRGMTNAATFLLWPGTNMTVVNNTIHGSQSDNSLIWADEDSTLTFQNNALVANQGSALVSLGSVTPSFNLYWDNDTEPSVKMGSDVLADPAFEDATLDCDANFRYPPGSPLVDAGDEAILDIDGTRSDIGAYGGPGAIAWDLDEDGLIEEDCNPLDPNETTGCDDPANTELVPRGWFCNQSGASPLGVGVAGLGLLAIRRRRRRGST
ncbi:MAG: right-handed parallel beta-helix repeat-containing protein [Myxococcota bacterium]